MLISVNVVILE